MRARRPEAKRAMSSAAGQSVIEMIIGLSVMAITLLATITWALHQNSVLMTEQKRLDADETVSLAAYALNRKFSAIGGGSVPLWGSFWAEDACAARSPLPDCDGSDRLTVVELSSDLPECPVIDYDPASGTLVSSDIEDVAGADPVPICCLTGFANRQIYISETNRYTARYVTSVNTANCSAATSAVQQAPALKEPSTGAFPHLSEGTISPVTITTYFLERNTQQLWAWTDSNNNNQFDDTEKLSVATPIFDFQIKVGYDIDKNDQISDSQSTTDEWLYNSSGDALGLGGLTGAQPQDLSRLGFSVIAGQVSSSETYTNAMYERWNGPIRDVKGWQIYGRKRIVVFSNKSLP